MVDYLLPQRRRTWRDSAWWRATVFALGSGVAMVAMACPLVVWLCSQLTALSRLQVGRGAMAVELAQGGLLMLPYLWAYFFALERLEEQRKKGLPPIVLERHLR